MSKLPEVNSEWHAKGDTRVRARKEKTEQLFFFATRGFTGYARGAWLHVFFPSPFVLLTCFHPFGTCYTFCHVSSLPLTAALLGNLFVTHATPCRWEITLALYRLAWENSRHYATPPFVSSQSDVWETTAEMPYWCQTCYYQEMGIVPLIGKANFQLIRSPTQI